MERSKRQPNLTIAQKEQILSLKNTGKSRTEISLIMGLQYQQVCRFLWLLDPSEIKEVDEFSKLKNDNAALQAKCERYEKALKEVNSYYDPIRLNTLVSMEAIKSCNEALAGDGEKEVGSEV